MKGRAIEDLAQKRRIVGRAGQGTVEAALLIPVVCVGILLLVQPAIVLYDRMVMADAAAETCRLLMTLPAEERSTADVFARRRLAAIPQQENFHVHEGGCAYRISCQGGEGSSSVEVCIENRLKPLPLIGAGAGFLGLLDGDGCLRVEVTSTMDAQPSWVASSPAGSAPAGWVGAWLE